jgi:hypothetical protein
VRCQSPCRSRAGSHRRDSVRKAVDDAQRQTESGLGPPDVERKNRELVPAETRNDIAFANAFGKPATNRDEELVPYRMTE